MNEQAATILVAFLIQAAPILEEAALKGLRWLVDQIPGTNADNFLWGCQDICRGIWADHPDWQELEKRWVAVEAITVLARDMGIVIDPELFAQLGLA